MGTVSKRAVAAAAVAAAVLASLRPLTAGAAASPASPALEDLRAAGREAGLDAVTPPAVPVAAPRAVSGAAFTPPARVMPDFSFTPGKLCTTADPDFKELRYPERIAYCSRHVTHAMKAEVAAHYGVPESEWKNFEFDHLIPLAIGGDSHVDNLWPEPRGGQNSDGKDKLELSLYYQLKAGTITQAEAVRQVYAWFDANGLPKLRAALAARAGR